MELFTPWHLIILAIVVAVLLFGSKQLPDMARSLGRSLRVFKTEIKGMTEDDKARDAAKSAAPDAGEPSAIEARKVVRIEAEPRQPAAMSRPRPTPTQGDRPSNGAR